MAYKVKKGDTLSAIAKAASTAGNKVTVSQIVKANPQITNPNLIRPGQVFNIPTKTPATPKPSAPKPSAPKPSAPKPTKSGSNIPVTGGAGADIPVDETTSGIDAAELARLLKAQSDLDKANRDIELAAQKKERELDSIAAITALLTSYGIGDLGSAIIDAVQKGYSADTINLMMQDPNGTDPLAKAFQVRFSANKVRAAAGKSVLSPGEYLAAERTYTQVLQSYGVANIATREKMSSFIANDISASEVSDRVGLAINRVQNADPATKRMLAEYYPMLNQSDIVGAVLDPAEGLPALQRKVQIAEIGGAALAQNLTTGIKAASNLKTGYAGLTTGAMGAEDLANLGVTQEQARAGFQQVAEITPRAEFLSSISGGEDYTRLQAEQEAFQGLASAKRARVNLTQSELARFGGSSGMSKTSLSKGNQGSF